MNRVIKGFYLVGVIVAIIVALGMLLEYKFLENIIRNELETVNRLQRDNVSVQVSAQLQLKGQVISDAATIITGETDEQHIFRYLVALMETNPSFSSIYFGTSENTMINGSGWIPPNSFDLRTRPWYQKAVQENRRIFTEAFLNASKEKLIVTVAMPVYNNKGILRGVVAGDINLENILRIPNDNNYSDSGYTLLIDSQGNVLSHPNYITNPLSQTPLNVRDISESLSDFLNDESTETISLELDGVKGFLSYEPVPETDWMICNFEPIKTHLHYENQMLGYFLMMTLSAGLVVLITLLIQKRYVIKPLVTLSTDIQKISVELDTSYRLPLQDHDPFLTLRELLNATLEKTESYFRQSQSHKEALLVANRQLETSFQKLAITECSLRKQNQVLIESQSALKSEEKRSRAIVNALPDLVFRLDENGVLLDCHATDESILLMKKENFLGKTLDAVMPQPVANLGLETITKALQEHSLQTCEYSLESPNGERHYEMRLAESSSREVIAIIRDITDQKLSHRRIEYLSYHDQLTGLYNRRFFVEAFRRLDTSGNLPFTIAMLDVNGLKLTNDAFGHQVGDELLKRVASVLISETRAGDIVARIGGDEFIVLLPNTSNEETEEIVKRILQCAALEKMQNVIISVSVGWETKTSADQTRRYIFARAEEHMYRKKLVDSQSMRNATIQIILRTLKETNERERVHSDKVSALCVKIAQALRLDSQVIKEIETAGLMHDIGKIAININLLNKPGKLTDEEYTEVQRHAEVGYQILKSVDIYSPLAESVLSHHENWDGSGYPRGLKEKEIPLFARIITVADAYEAMTSDRPYRAGIPKADALIELRHFAGIQFDPDIVDVINALEI